MDQITITLFGSFTMEYQNRIYDMEQLLTKQLSSLLVLLVYQQRPISKEELISQFWSDAEHPQNALKYSVFRLRNALKKLQGLHELNLIVTTKHGYVFAPDMVIKTDFNEMNQLWNDIQSKDKSSEEFINDAKYMISLYQGPLYTNAEAMWMMQAQTYYQNIYEKVFEAVCEHYITQKEYDAVLEAAQSALHIDKFFDSAYSFIMQIYILKQNYKKAMNLYQYAHRMYLDEYGSKPAGKLKDLYASLLHKEDALEIQEVKKRLQEEKQMQGAFYCDYEAFRHAYQIYLRNNDRNEYNCFLIILQIDHVKMECKKSDYMTKLKELIQKSLRRSDVFTKINTSQYAVLITCHSKDEGYAVIQRITSAFYKSITKSKAKLHYFITAIDE